MSMLPNQTEYVMNYQSKRYGDKCHHCKGRIHLNRKFIVDPVDSKRTFHADCYRLFYKDK